MALKFVGRALQLAGLLALPASMLLELNKQLDRLFGVSQMVYMLVFGVAIFYVGRMLEGYAGGASDG